jgi:phosphoglycerate dehydrogenase-like enzyme
MCFASIGVTTPSCKGFAALAQIWINQDWVIVPRTACNTMLAMKSLLIVHPEFERTWPFVADEFARLWQAQGPLQFDRLKHDDERVLGDIVNETEPEIDRVVTLGVPITQSCQTHFPNLKEIALEAPYQSLIDAEMAAALQARGVRCYKHPSEGFWGQSVSEFGLALTLCGLRRIPQLHHAMLSDLAPWDYEPPNGVPTPGGRGHQFGDDLRFSNGTLHGKRVRIVGAGNIASRYASFCHMLGADVAAYDPFAQEPNFHRAGSRREWHLDRLVRDAEIFVPMVPLTNGTRGLVTRQHIEALPKGCLVVMVTRALICDTQAIRERVLRDELALAADVFDVEPLPLADPLLGRANVVHTPHNAGRTMQANYSWAAALAEQFLPR